MIGKSDSDQRHQSTLQDFGEEKYLVGALLAICCLERVLPQRGNNTPLILELAKYFSATKSCKTLIGGGL